MSAEEREKTQYNWTHDKVQIIAATIAFGMGKRCQNLQRSILSTAGQAVVRLDSKICKHCHSR